MTDNLPRYSVQPSVRLDDDRTPIPREQAQYHRSPAHRPEPLTRKERDIKAAKIIALAYPLCTAVLLAPAIVNPFDPVADNLAAFWAITSGALLLPVAWVASVWELICHWSSGGPK